MLPVLSLPKPCPTSWGAMMPTATGRHCAACQKTVVDFTNKTDAEILAHLAQATGGTCGRFRSDQLGRPLWRPVRASPRRLWLSAVLAASSMLSAVKAGVQPKYALSTTSVPFGSPATSTSILQEVSPTSRVPGEPVTLQGTIVDARTGEHLPGVTILLKGAQTEISTNADGNFTLRLQPESKRITLVVSSVGYETIEKTIKLKHQPSVLRFRLKMSHAVLGEIAYIEPTAGFLGRLSSFFLRT